MSKKTGQTPWLDQRAGSDRYYAFWYDRDSQAVKRLSLRTTDRDEATRRFAAFLVEGEAITNPGRGDELTVSQALDDYFREHVRERCAAPERQEYAILNLKAHFGDTPLEKVDIPMSRGYATARREGLVGGKKAGVRRQAQDSTIRRELNVLRASGNHALKWGRISRPPIIELPAEHVLGRDDEAPHFTKDEVKLLIETASGELQHFIALCYWTGARRRSIQDLTTDQVKWDAGRVFLQAPGKRTTKKRQPIVPILVDMKPHLRALCDDAGSGPLFKRRDFYNPFRKHCQEVLGRHGKPHLLRHSRATHMLQDGIDIYHVAKLLGDTIDTIDRVYGHHAADYLAEAIGG